ncbi:hypothetical protein BGX26_004768 [Mortierella sp. AD094]|nr:hypothetical protein BGX26_004768 [Mortierella sp. AD094]
MKWREFSKSHRLMNTWFYLFLVTPYITSSTHIHAASTSASTANQEQTPGGNVIRSIGFRDCGSFSSLELIASSDSSAVRLSSLALLYDEKTNKISLKAEGSTDHEFDATTAHILLTAYDRVFYDQRIDLSKAAPFVPHFKGRFSFRETFSALTLLPEQLPKQLFSLPAVEALLSIQLYNAQGKPVLCTSVPLTNTVSAHSPVITIASVSVTAAAIALTAISSILASLTSAAMLTSLPLAATGSGAGGSNPSSGLSPSVWDVVSFCQFISMSGSLNVEYPELQRQWTQNFGWSMGLIHSENWNKAIDGLRSRTTRTNSSNVRAEKPTLNTTSDTGERILYSGNMCNSTTTSGLSSNKTVTAMSMQSMVDDAVTSIVEKSGHTGNKTEAIAIAKLRASKLMSSSAAFKSEAHQLSRRQAATQPGAELLPSLQDSSLMNRISDISDLKSLNSQPVASPTSPQSTLPTSWPNSDYHTSTGPLSQRGLAAFGERLQIPAENMFMTSLFLFLILILMTSVLALFVRITLEAYAYFRPSKFVKLRRRFSSYYIGNLLRVVLLAYFAVVTMAFYQLTLKDSWTITLLAAMTLVLFLALITYITLRLRRAGGTSLFFDERLKSKYGTLYDQYVTSAYWFFVPVLAYQIVKAAIVGLGNGGRDTSSGSLDHHGSSASWAQTSLLLLVEVCFAAVLIWKHPFADKTPNRLNGILGCVRALNVVMLAILIEGTAVSTVSRTAVGVVITCTQALMMIILACLILYQLGRALWRLWLAVKARNEDKHCKKDNINPLDREEVIVVSIKDNEKYDRDDDEPQGRMASEIARPGNESMTRSNPTIRCIPASDDEDDGFGIEDEDFEKDVTPGRYKANNRHDSPPDRTGDEAAVETKESLQGSIRDSAQSAESHSSLILDYYNPSYLPPSIRSKVLHDNSEGSEPADQNGDGAEGLKNPSWVPSHQHTLMIPSTSINEPWVQAAYMTRRRSESSVQNGGRQNSRGISKDRTQLSSRQRLEQEEEDDDELQQQLQQQRRRRPMSMGAARHSLEPMTFSMFAVDMRRKDSRSTRSSRIADAFPTFQGTYIPESLLAGPPPPSSMQPRRPSAVTANFSTSQSLSPVLFGPPPQYSEAPAPAPTPSDPSIPIDEAT